MCCLYIAHYLLMDCFFIYHLIYTVSGLLMLLFVLRPALWRIVILLPWWPVLWSARSFYVFFIFDSVTIVSIGADHRSNAICHHRIKVPSVESICTFFSLSIRHWRRYITSTWTCCGKGRQGKSNLVALLFSLGGAVETIFLYSILKICAPFLPLSSHRTHIRLVVIDCQPLLCVFFVDERENVCVIDDN